MEGADYYEDYEGEGHEQSGLGEIAVGPAFSGEHVDCVTTVRFDVAEECLWVGTQGGILVQHVCPSLQRYAYIATHLDGILAMRSMGSSCVTLSPSQLCVHSSGGVPRLSFEDEVCELIHITLCACVCGVCGGRSPPSYNITCYIAWDASLPLVTYFS